MFEYMINKNTTLKEDLTKEGLTNEDFLFIKEIILGRPLQQVSSEDPTVSNSNLLYNVHLLFY